MSAGSRTCTQAGTFPMDMLHNMMYCLQKCSECSSPPVRKLPVSRNPGRSNETLLLNGRRQRTTKILERPVIQTHSRKQAQTHTHGQHAHMRNPKSGAKTSSVRHLASCHPPHIPACKQVEGELEPDGSIVQNPTHTKARRGICRPRTPKHEPLCERESRATFL